MALALGHRVGPYEITGTLGAGGMGEVYRARDTKLGRDIALKVIPETFALDLERVTEAAPLKPERLAQLEEFARRRR